MVIMTYDKPEVLIVDDRQENLYILDRMLRALDVEVVQALSGAEALNLTLEHDFCVAIVDIQMPEMDGYQLVALLRSNADTATLPVIFVSAIYSDEYHHRKGYEAGAVDFMSKPFVPEILLSKVKVFVDLYRQRRTLEEEIQRRRQAEAALQEANLALYKLNVDKDKFLSIISHDLRGPFNIVLGNAQLLIKKLDSLSESDIQDTTYSIYSGARAAYNLLENLLTWSQMQRAGGIELRPGPIELRGLAHETLEVLEQTAAQKEIGVRNLIAPSLWVQADRYMLEAVIRNLASNALKFTPRGGQVTLAARADNTVVTVSVKDTGVGISPADVVKLFRLDAQHTTPGTEKERGSGLGLIICKEMVEQNGGQITVESELGAGTTVEFTVPRAARPAG
jgi:two-component system sensor histidine kinase/response regulator